MRLKDSRERVYERTINVLLRKVKPDYAWPRLQKDEAKVSACACVCENILKKKYGLDTLQVSMEMYLKLLLGWL